MAKLEFNAVTLEMIQSLVFPLVQTLTGFDPEGWAGEQADLFNRVGDGLGDLSALFLVVGGALEDGKLSAEEINEIVAKAVTLPDAIDKIVSFFDDEEIVPVEETPVDPVQ